MSNAWLGLVGLIIALAAMGGTLWQGRLLRRQLLQAEQVSRSQFYHGITTRFIELNRQFMDHPELLKYFHEGSAPPTDEQCRARVDTLSAMVANLADLCCSHDRILGELSPEWNSYFKFIYANSPAFRCFWDESSRFWPERVNQCFVPLAVLS